MGRNKAVGPDQITNETWRCLEDEEVKWLTCLFNKIFLSAKMPDEWRLSEVIPIYKNKGDVQACSNYRGIKLLSHTMKLWERVIERRLRRETRVSENQFGFISEWSTTEVIHLLISLMEKYRERQRDLHMAFLDLEKAYDSVPRELLWRTLRDKGTPRRYLRVIKDMYEGVKTRVRTIMGSIKFFQVEVGLHQDSAISLYCFTLIMDELSRGIQESIPWCMIFADDIVLIAESAEGLNNRIEKWREAQEENGLRVSKEKTKYIRCDFDRYEVLHQEVNIRIGDRILQPKESFRYLGSVIHRSGMIDEDVAHRIGVECWPITKAQTNRVEVAELRMLRRTCGKTMVDMIPNGVFRAEVDVDSIIDKMREGRLRWFGHVKRRPKTAPVRRIEAMLVEESRKRGRPKLRWEDRLKKNMKELLLSEDMTFDRNAWRDRIRISGCCCLLCAGMLVCYACAACRALVPGGRGRICLRSPPPYLASAGFDTLRGDVFASNRLKRTRYDTPETDAFEKYSQLCARNVARRLATTEDTSLGASSSSISQARILETFAVTGSLYAINSVMPPCKRTREDMQSMLVPSEDYPLKRARASTRHETRDSTGTGRGRRLEVYYSMRSLIFLLPMDYSRMLNEGHKTRGSTSTGRCRRSVRARASTSNQRNGESTGTQRGGRSVRVTSQNGEGYNTFMNAGHLGHREAEYHLCCGGGRIHMGPEPESLEYIKLLFQNKHFMKNIRAYNQMFAMTSFGAKIDESINRGGGPYVFKLSVQV
ncbi:retrovirus-related pol polyprotein LINE-1, partial [Tanacetum coccineum]